MFLSFIVLEDADSVILHLVRHLVIFFWVGQNTTATATTESPLAWSKKPVTMNVSYHRK